MRMEWLITADEDSDCDKEVVEVMLDQGCCWYREGKEGKRRGECCRVEG